MFLDEKHVAKLRSWSKEKLEAVKADTSSRSLALVVECVEKDLSASDAEAKLEKLVGRSEVKHFVERLFQRAKRYSEESRDAKRKHEPDEEDGKKRVKLEDSRDDKPSKADGRDGEDDRGRANGSGAMSEAAAGQAAAAPAAAPSPPPTAGSSASQAPSAGAAAGAAGSAPPKEEKKERKKRRWDDDAEPAKPVGSVAAIAAALPSPQQLASLVSSLTSKVLQPKKSPEPEGGESSPAGASGEGAAAKAGEPGAKSNIAEALAAVEKAKQAALLQKKIQEQMKAMQARKDAAAAGPAASPTPLAPSPSNIPISANSIAAAAAAAQALAAKMGAMGAMSSMGIKGFVPPPLIVDKEGRELDSSGKVVVNKPVFAPVATLKANVMRKKLAAFKIETPRLETDRAKNPFFDPRVPINPSGARSKRNFKFVEPGTFVKKGEHMRARALADEMNKERKEREAEEGAEGLDANLIPVGGAGALAKKAGPSGALSLPPALLEYTPEVEWWDEPVLAGGSYESVGEDGSVALNEANVTIYVQHPVPIEPPAEPPAPPIRPLMLTAKERKKLRKRNRAEAEKEKQDQVRLGLVPPPEPKLKLSNMMKVLGNQAVADPTALEKKVREQVAARQKGHEDANAARKLTKEERTEKTRSKLLADTETEIHVALYRIDRLEHKQHKYKVDVNAQQNLLTGVAIVREGCSAVIVEGGAKSIKRYSRLMLHRIDWSTRPAKKEPEAGAAAAEEDEEEEEDEKRPKNRCVLAWQGTVLKRAFDRFSFENCKTDADAKAFLARFSVEHYWDMARNYQEPE
eukprot:tig00020816_g14151.t1